MDLTGVWGEKSFAVLLYTRGATTLLLCLLKAEYEQDECFG